MGLEGRAPPMSRIISACLCAIMAFVSVAGVSLLQPAPALAANGTLKMETPLHESPDPASPLIALLSEGAVVSIDGPPVDGFYPVSTDGLSGWMRGETLALTKDIVEEPVEYVATPDETGALVPVEQEASNAPLAAEEQAPPAEQATDSPPSNGNPAEVAPVSDAAADAASLPGTSPAPVQTDVAVEPAAAPAPESTPSAVAPGEETSPPATDGWVSSDPATEPVAAEAAPAEATAAPAPETTAPAGSNPEPEMVEPVPAEMATAEPTPGQEQTPSAASVEPAAAAPAAEPAPEPAPEVAPAPEEPAPLGPAGVAVDMPIFTGPGTNYGVVFTVPMGSTVEQTGQVVDGFVSVRYKEVVGWAAADHLTDPSDFATDAPEATAEPVDTKTPKPGSGVAFATVDLSLRSGPSANAEPITMVPAGSRLVLTGVMEGDFQRVTYGDLIGWIANEYLETPVDPASNGEAPGKQKNYSRKEIVRYITQAAKKYDQSADDMLRVAQCESNLDPYAVNPSGSYGLFQFIRSTWKSTPYGNEDIFDPRANSNAAAWMWAQGRKSEWVCQ